MRTVRTAAWGLALLFGTVLCGSPSVWAACLQRGPYMEEALPYTSPEGDTVAGEQRLGEMWGSESIWLVGIESRCVGNSIRGRGVLKVDNTGWKRRTPPDPVIAEINALKLPIEVEGTTGRDGLISLTHHWFWWTGDKLDRWQVYTQNYRVYHLDERLYLLREGVEPMELTPNGAAVEIRGDERFALEVELLGIDDLPGSAERWIDLRWMPALPITIGAVPFTDTRSIKAAAGGGSRLRTGWLAPKRISGLTWDEWVELPAAGFPVLTGQTVAVSLSSWTGGRHPLLFTVPMPEPKELRFVRLSYGTELPVDPATIGPGDDLRVVAIYDDDVDVDAGSILLRSGATTMSIAIARTPEDPRVFKSGTIRIKEASVKAAEVPPNPTGDP